jgi:hypothetical protein
VGRGLDRGAPRDQPATHTKEKDEEAMTPPYFELHHANGRKFVAPTDNHRRIRFTGKREKAAWFNQHHDAELFRRELPDSADWSVVEVVDP